MVDFFDNGLVKQNCEHWLVSMASSAIIVVQVTTTATNSSVNDIPFTLSASDNDGMDWSQASCQVAYKGGAVIPSIVVSSACTSGGSCQFTIHSFTPDFAGHASGDGSSREITYSVTCSIQDESGNQPSSSCVKEFVVEDKTLPQCGSFSGLDPVVWLCICGAMVVLCHCRERVRIINIAFVSQPKSSAVQV